ncbi:FecR family protein [Sphingobacterium psychroaquaticum]|uniref:FecR family protein n=1 Tax=Sphingobacterium psychroaquaticum TaxID=561061 RepID=UPI00106D8C99|nr:FecR family protein [Sphingobacterium psychroaquaticum]QBQ39952.1 FecR family protein [Sphingobacterium psychroaquaticum]
MKNRNDLFDLYLAGKCTPEEAEQFVSGLSDDQFCAELEVRVDEVFRQELRENEVLPDMVRLSKEQYVSIEALIFTTVAENEEERVRSISSTIWRWAAAAAAIIIFYVGFDQWNKDHSMITGGGPIAAVQDTTETPTGVTLTLPNGQVVALADHEAAQYASREKQDGVSFYELKASDVVQEPMVQQINVPQGQTGAVVLTDGTKVWLNANSSLTYDVNFVGNERLVKLQGEAYFEVTPNKEKPFIVESKNQQVKVLGTHFNVKAYTVSHVITTLLEGKVQVSTGAKERILKPGQSSVVGFNDSDIKVVPAICYEVNAWRNNEFAFYDATLNDISDELSRWYGVEVQVVGRSDSFGFTGVISREKSLPEVLEILRRTGQIRYHIVPTGLKERRIILML